MMKKIIRLTESDLSRIVKKVIKEEDASQKAINSLKNVGTNKMKWDYLTGVHKYVLKGLLEDASSSYDLSVTNSSVMDGLLSVGSSNYAKLLDPEVTSQTFLAGYSDEDVSYLLFDCTAKNRSGKSKSGGRSMSSTPANSKLHLVYEVEESSGRFSTPTKKKVYVPVESQELETDLNLAFCVTKENYLIAKKELESRFNNQTKNGVPKDNTSEYSSILKDVAQPLVQKLNNLF